MGGFDTVEQWRRQRIREIVDRLDSPHADKIFLAKDYTKADLRRDLMETIADIGTDLESFSTYGPVVDLTRKSTV